MYYMIIHSLYVINLGSLTSCYQVIQSAKTFDPCKTFFIRIIYLMFLYARYINSISWNCFFSIRMTNPVLIPILEKGKCFELSVTLSCTKWVAMPPHLICDLHVLRLLRLYIRLFIWCVKIVFRHRGHTNHMPGQGRRGQSWWFGLLHLSFHKTLGSCLRPTKILPMGPLARVYLQLGNIPVCTTGYSGYFAAPGLVLIGLRLILMSRILYIWCVKGVFKLQGHTSLMPGHPPLPKEVL